MSLFQFVETSSQFLGPQSLDDTFHTNGLYIHIPGLLNLNDEDITEGACSMAVPAMSTRPRTSALRMPSTHPAIWNANYR